MKIFKIHHPQQVDDLFPSLLRCTDLVHNQTFHNAFADRHAWIQRGEGVLEDDLHILTHLFEFFAPHIKQAFAIDGHFPTCRGNQTEQCATDCCFATARLTDQPQCFTAFDRETNTVNGFDLRSDPLQKATSELGNT